MYTTVNMYPTQYMYIPFYGYYRQRKYIISATGNNCSMLTQDLHVADRHQCYDTVSTYLRAGTVHLSLITRRAHDVIKV